MLISAIHCFGLPDQWASDATKFQDSEYVHSCNVLKLTLLSVDSDDYCSPVNCDTPMWRCIKFDTQMWRWCDAFTVLGVSFLKFEAVNVTVVFGWWYWCHYWPSADDFCPSVMKHFQLKKMWRFYEICFAHVGKSSTTVSISVMAMFETEEVRRTFDADFRNDWCDACKGLCQ